MENKDLISVIVPVYNIEEYIDECVKSILNQTYENIEVILVDDGSTDKCPQKCDEWAKKDNRIEVIHKINGGLSDARNTGVNKASGEYIAFIDGDDVINRHMIEVLYRNIIKEKADLSICNLQRFKDNISEDRINKEIYDNNLFVYRDEKKFENLFNERIGSTVSANNKLYKKSLFSNVKFPLNKYHEDVWTAHYFVDAAKIIVYTDEILYFYRYRNQSITSSFDLKRLNEVDGMKDRMQFFCSKYRDTKYANLSIIAYGDKIIRTYCLLKYNNLNKKYNQSLKNLKYEYNINFKKIIRAPEMFSRKIKHVFFLILPNLFYKMNIGKYTKKRRKK